ncbi:WhiB family transcriptional regulator [Bifidobacterium longum]|uniref:WhiB family transcriptional regulator n=1 Tax=Bifidobacterium longum TaxID=216816 RepID=UPI00067B5BD6|nr:WhiB family transcriptional regulator [Bifidobacterium longum]MDQ4445404.1 WhiB family transcriptional regulator [Bifidobacterium longum]MEC3825290.1 WhiB family transcriptional regulator [Bifidobacterium longum]
MESDLRRESPGFSRGEDVNEIAKQACLSCPVRAECLRQALETGEQYGIWGGMTPEERRDLARRDMRRRRIAAVRMRGLAR